MQKTTALSLFAIVTLAAASASACPTSFGNEPGQLLIVFSILMAFFSAPIAIVGWLYQFGRRDLLSVIPYTRRVLGAYFVPLLSGTFLATTAQLVSQVEFIGDQYLFVFGASAPVVASVAYHAWITHRARVLTVEQADAELSEQNDAI